jgi:hypothetical protein
MNSGNCIWYKYYCPSCRAWYTYTTSWNLADYNQCEHEYELPFRDGTIADNPAWFAHRRWVRVAELMPRVEG